jgi:hypothetical protein
VYNGNYFTLNARGEAPVAHETALLHLVRALGASLLIAQAREAAEVLVLLARQSLDDLESGT